MTTYVRCNCTITLSIHYQHFSLQCSAPDLQGTEWPELVFPGHSVWEVPIPSCFVDQWPPWNWGVCSESTKLHEKEMLGIPLPESAPINWFTVPAERAGSSPALWTCSLYVNLTHSKAGLHCMVHQFHQVLDLRFLSHAIFSSNRQLTGLPVWFYGQICVPHLFFPILLRKKFLSSANTLFSDEK